MRRNRSRWTVHPIEQPKLHSGDDLEIVFEVAENALVLLPDSCELIILLKQLVLELPGGKERDVVDLRR